MELRNFSELLWTEYFNEENNTLFNMDLKHHLKLNNDCKYVCKDVYTDINDYLVYVIFTHDHCENYIIIINKSNKELYYGWHFNQGISLVAKIKECIKEYEKIPIHYIKEFESWNGNMKLNGK